jgi:hypothetical protein
MLLALLALPLAPSTFADDDSTNEDSSLEMQDDDIDEDEDEENTSTRENRKVELKKDSEDRKNEIKEKKDELKKSVELNREEAKQNREDFREEYKDDVSSIRVELTAEQKTELETLKTETKVKIEALENQLQLATTDADKVLIRAKMKEVIMESYETMKEILGSDSNGIDILDKKELVLQENSRLREESKELRTEYKNVKKSLVEKYRQVFLSKLENTLDKIPTDRLPEISARIQVMIDNNQDNSNLLAALIALQEIIDDRTDTVEVEDEIMTIVNDLLAE